MVEVKCVKAQLVDGYGKTVEGYAFVDADEVRFIDMKAVSRPVQGWAAKELQKRLGFKKKI